MCALYPLQMEKSTSQVPFTLVLTNSMCINIYIEREIGMCINININIKIYIYSYIYTYKEAGTCERHYDQSIDFLGFRRWVRWKEHLAQVNDGYCRRHTRPMYVCIPKILRLHLDSMIVFLQFSLVGSTWFDLALSLFFY